MDKSLRNKFVDWCEEFFETHTTNVLPEEFVMLYGIELQTPPDKETPAELKDPLYHLVDKRSRALGLELTDPANLLIGQMSIGVMGKVSQLLAVIKYMHSPLNHGEVCKGIINCNYLLGVFSNRWPTDKTFDIMWDKQKLPDGKNMVDVILSTDFLLPHH